MLVGCIAGISPMQPCNDAFGAVPNIPAKCDEKLCLQGVCVVMDRGC